MSRQTPTFPNCLELHFEVQLKIKYVKASNLKNYRQNERIFSRTRFQSREKYFEQVSPKFATFLSHPKNGGG